MERSIGLSGKGSLLLPKSSSMMKEARVATGYYHKMDHSVLMREKTPSVHLIHIPPIHGIALGHWL